jgi:pantothenate kinase
MAKLSDAMTAPTIDLAGLAELLLDRSAGSARVVAAIAGPPGSGKSTIAENLADLLNSARAGSAAVLPMDGFHFDDLYLVPAGLRPRKGAPETFDVGGLFHILKRIRARDEPFVAVPVFDRDLEIARSGARTIPADVPIIIVEGNYLLLRQDPWACLRPLFDVAALIDVPEPILRERLTARWQHYNLTLEQIAWKLDGNDLPNGRFVMSESRGEDFRLVPTA